ncbi:MAG: nitroreductase family protein [Bacteroidales bacterium]|nr:nitroreductase family protein [Bacteroidales bacterium]
MKMFRFLLTFALFLTAMTACADKKAPISSEENQVIKTIMERRSVRKYAPNAVAKDTMEIILDCGINAPNAMNRQSWEIRVVDMNKHPEFAEALPAGIFRGAPTMVFVAAEKAQRFSPVDCGLLGENMILAAQSMGVNSVVLGGPAAMIAENPELKYLLDTLAFSAGYELIYCIGFGYGLENPDAKPRMKEKYRFID